MCHITSMYNRFNNVLFTNELGSRVGNWLRPKGDHWGSDEHFHTMFKEEQILNSCVSCPLNPKVLRVSKRDGNEGGAGYCLSDPK